MTADARIIEGDNTLLGITTNTIIKGTATGQQFAGMVRRIVCQATNTAAAFIIDGTTTTPTAANTVWTVGSGGMAVGAVTYLNFPVKTGLIVVPGGGTFNLSWD